MNLAAYAEVGLVLFMAAFVVIAAELLRRGKTLEALALLPLESTTAKDDAEEERTLR